MEFAPRNTFRNFGLVAAVVLLSAGVAATTALAQSNRSEQSATEQKTRKTPAMRESVYNKFAQAQEAIEVDDEAEAIKVLGQVQNMKNLNGYEIAMMWNTYAYIYFSQEKYAEAIDAYKNVLAQPELPYSLEYNTIYSLAQLHFVSEDYRTAIQYLSQWMQVADNPGPDAYIIMGQAYYALEDYRDGLPYVERGVSLSKERGLPVRENWYLLLRAMYWELDDMPKVRDVLIELLALWPKQEYWTQLAAIYGEMEEEKKQLAAYEAAYLQGGFTRGSQLRTLANLYLYHDVPYRGAVILEKGIRDGKIEATSSNLRTLAQAWSDAKEMDKAIPALERAARVADDGDLYAELANILLDREEWEAAESAAQKALNKGKLNRPDLPHVARGMALFNMKRYNEAIAAFRRARRYDESKRIAAQWIRYVGIERDRQAALAAALQ